MVADLIALPQDGHGRPAWKHETGDLNLNLIVLDAGSAMSEHRNAEVDVLLIGVTGEGVVVVEGQEHELAPSRVVVIPKGTTRSIRCDSGRCAYPSCHRRRAGLWPLPRPVRRSNRPESWADAEQ